jgi:hypothetical protein
MRRATNATERRFRAFAAAVPCWAFQLSLCQSVMACWKSGVIVQRRLAIFAGYVFLGTVLTGIASGLMG